MSTFWLKIICLLFTVWPWARVKNINWGYFLLLLSLKLTAASTLTLKKKWFPLLVWLLIVWKVYILWKNSLVFFQRAQIFLCFKVWITFLRARMTQKKVEKSWNFVGFSKNSHSFPMEKSPSFLGTNFGTNWNFITKSHITSFPIEPHVLMYILLGFSQSCGRSYVPKFGGRIIIRSRIISMEKINRCLGALIIKGKHMLCAPSAMQQQPTAAPTKQFKCSLMHFKCTVKVLKQQQNYLVCTISKVQICVLKKHKLNLHK